MQPIPWLKDAVIYQIYPQSFQDSNGDGIGDFQGLISRLDYIKSIGITAIWLNPCFDSPFGDAGYDVRNFYKIAPRYGSEDDFRALAEAVHTKGMKIILDLVAGHTSMDNEWFVDEAKSIQSEDSNRYIWKSRHFDSEAGPQRGDFVSNFFWHQPALNFGYANPSEPWQDAVDAPGPLKNRAELKKIMSHWYDLGCDGFRVDMASFLVKPAECPEARKETIKLWHEIRSWHDEHYPECALIAEWSEPIEAIAAGFDLDFMMHFNAPGYPSLFFNEVGSLPPSEGPCYFDARGKGSLKIFAPEYARQLDGTRGKGYVSLPVANHDVQRLRCGPRDWDQLRCAWIFFMTQAGPPTIYYGEEIGMRFLEDTPPKEGSTLKDITAANAGTLDGERSGTRTPMQWDNSPNAGFSTAPAGELYLPLDPDENRPTVDAQEADPESLLNFVRKLLTIRKQHPALGSDASYRILNQENENYPMVILRETHKESVLIIINPTAKERTISIEMGIGALQAPILASACRLIPRNSQSSAKLELTAFGYGIFPIEHSS